MISNLSLRTTVLVVSILISGILIPIGIFASPIFETETAETGNSFFEPEQSISNPLYLIQVANFPGDGVIESQISNLDVVVYDTSEVYLVYLDVSLGVTNVFLTITNSSITNGTSGQPYFVDSFNSTTTIQLNENDWDNFVSGGPFICNSATQPKIAVTDSHVFVAWNDIASTAAAGSCPSPDPSSRRIAAIAIPKGSFDDLTTAFFNPVSTTPAYFDTGDDLPVSFSIAANGTNAYIAWENATDNSVNIITFDGAGYFASPANDDFNTPFNFGVSTSSPLNPVIVADGTNVFVAWQNGTAGDKNIRLVNSTDSGGTFGDIRDVSGTPSANSIQPKLAEDGGIVHVSWQESVSGASQLFVASSGNSYSPVAASTISGTSTVAAQQIIADGVNVFNVWQETIDGGPSTEILFSRSSDSGVTFDTPINLSTSSGDSVLPKISGNSTLVNVVWRDDTFLPSNTFGTTPKVDGQVWFKSYNVTSGTLSGLQVISESTNRTSNTFFADNTVNTFPTITNPTPIPNISSAGEVVVAVWNPDPSLASTFPTHSQTWEGSMKAASTSKIDISFNSTEYLSPRNATITVVDPSQASAGTVNVNVLGTSMTTKSTVVLTEGTTLGTFSAEIELYDSTFKGALGDIFTANYTTTSSGDITTQAMIQETRILDFLTENDSTGNFFHSIGDIVGLQLIDAGSNTTASTIETVDVTITSVADTTGVILTLTETGINTGIFEIYNSLVFMNGTLTPSLNDSITITKTKTSGNDILTETIDQKVTTTTNPTGITMTLTETGDATNVYTADLSICDSSNPQCISPNISGVAGDFISISNTDGTQVSNGIILPVSGKSSAALLVSCGPISCGLVTATYNGLSVSINPRDQEAAGGGGGGVSRAGLVVNALAGLSSLSSGIGGGGADGSPPITSLERLISNKNFDVPDEIVKIIESSDSTTPLAPISTSTFADFDLPLTINENGYPLGGYSNTIQTFSASTGEPMTMTALYYEQTALQHVSMYMNLRDNTSGDLSKSDTQILYNKDKPLQVIDPNGFFEKVSVNIIEDEETIKKFAEFEIIFAKPMEKSDIVLRSWDDKLRSMDTIIYDAIEVIDPASIVETVDPEPVENIIEPVADVQKVPEGLKNVSEWWSQGEITEDDFLNAIEYLVKNEIIQI